LAGDRPNLPARGPKDLPFTAPWLREENNRGHNRDDDTDGEQFDRTEARRSADGCLFFVPDQQDNARFVSPVSGDI
jgi:hypothetical protein